MQLERYCVVDVETTGFSPYNDRIVEVACALVDGDRVVERWATLVNPGVPIPPGATAVHGITDAMVAAAPQLPFALAQVRRRCERRLVTAHSAHFDLAFLGAKVATEALCTLRLARAIFPESPNHKNQTLRRYLNIDCIAGEELAAHRALGDALVTAHVLIACRRRFLRSRWGESWARFVRRHALIYRRAA
jgi:DNA polymerase-3 subunit epsilon